MIENGSGRRHTRDDVATTALRILDQYGLPDLTMRRLAAALDVQPSALYHHFPNKQSLLAELADRIVDTRSHEAPVGRRPAPADWAAGLRAEALGLRDSLLAYRDGAEVVSSTLALGLGASAAGERLAAVLRAGGVGEPTASSAATALLHFVLGHVSHEQQRLQYDTLGVLAPDVEASALEEDQATAFLFGVDLFVAGLEARAREVNRSRR